MDSSLRERFERLGPVRVVDQNTSGSPAVFLLRLEPGQDISSRVDAMLALTKRGISMLRGKRAVEALLSDRRVLVELPLVEPDQTLTAELEATGISVTVVPPPGETDVRALRERLNLTREQFALRFGLEVETLRNWEIGRRAPDATAKSYLRVIENNPELAERALMRMPGDG